MHAWEEKWWEHRNRLKLSSASTVERNQFFEMARIDLREIEAKFCIPNALEGRTSSMRMSHPPEYDLSRFEVARVESGDQSFVDLFVKDRERLTHLQSRFRFAVRDSKVLLMTRDYITSDGTVDPDYL